MHDGLAWFGIERKREDERKNKKGKTKEKQNGGREGTHSMRKRHAGEECGKGPAQRSTME